MSLKRKIAEGIQRRIFRVRNKLDKSKLRVSVFRSLNNIYAQVIDDNAQKTLVSCSSMEMKNVEGDKKAVARAVGLELAKRARDKNITAVVFDRGPFLFHGRVKSLAEGLREGGLHV